MPSLVIPSRNFWFLILVLNLFLVLKHCVTIYLFIEYGPALIEHVLLGAGFVGNVKFGKDFSLENDCGRVHKALCEADDILGEAASKPSKVYDINLNL